MMPFCAFVIIPSTNNEIQKICLRRKYSTLQNILKPATACDGELCVISAVKATKNYLFLGLDITLIRAKHCVEDIEKCINYCIDNFSSD